MRNMRNDREPCSYRRFAATKRSFRSLLVALGAILVAGPVLAVPITPLDWDVVGGSGTPVLTMPAVDVTAFNPSTSTWVDIGDLSAVVYREAPMLYSYTFSLTSQHPHLSEFNTGFAVPFFTGEAGYSFSEASAAGVSYAIHLDPDGTIDWSAASGTLDPGESVTFFFRSTEGPASLGAYNVINSLTGFARAPAPGVPEPTAMLLFAAGLGVVGLGARRRVSA